MLGIRKIYLALIGLLMLSCTSARNDMLSPVESFKKSNISFVKKNDELFIGKEVEENSDLFIKITSQANEDYVFLYTSGFNVESQIYRQYISNGKINTLYRITIPKDVSLQRRILSTSIRCTNATKSYIVKSQD